MYGKCNNNTPKQGLHPKSTAALWDLILLCVYRIVQERKVRVLILTHVRADSNVRVHDSTCT